MQRSSFPKCQYFVWYSHFTANNTVSLLTFLITNPIENLMIIAKNTCVVRFADHSGWPRGLRHDPSSTARTLESRVRIPLET
jgi:hypothetical protein